LAVVNISFVTAASIEAPLAKHQAPNFHCRYLVHLKKPLVYMFRTYQSILKPFIVEYKYGFSEVAIQFL